MKITSTKFEHNGAIPEKYTCYGENINPPLKFEGVPAEAKSLALVVDDPDAAGGTWTHWVLWNIDPATTEIAENSIPSGAVQGTTSAGEHRYGGPCPPSGAHHYHFRLYALDAKLDMEPTADKSQLGKTIINHFVEQADIVGIYSHAA